MIEPTDLFVASSIDTLADVKCADLQLLYTGLSDGLEPILEIGPDPIILLDGRVHTSRSTACGYLVYAIRDSYLSQAPAAADYLSLRAMTEGTAINSVIASTISAILAYNPLLTLYDYLMLMEAKLLTTKQRKQLNEWRDGYNS